MTNTQIYSLLEPQERKSPHLIITQKDLKTLLGNYLYSRNFDIIDYLTDDITTIVYRQELFADLLHEPMLADLLRSLLPLLENMDELYRLRENSHQTEGQLYAIKLIELYLTFIDTALKGFTCLQESIRSKSLTRFAKGVCDIAQSQDYRNLKTNTRKLSGEIAKVKCVTVGLNLDATFSPCEFGVLALHDEYMQTNGLMERLLGQNETHGLSAICPLKNTSKLLSKEEKRFADMAVSSVLNRLFKNAIADWEPAVKAFFRQHTKHFLPLIGEIRFILFGFDILAELKAKALPLTVPAVKPKEQKAFCVESLYHPTLALQKHKIVPNDLVFDENGRIYLMTGPNSGGKTVFLTAVGICQIFTQLGFPVPAKRAEISPADHLLVHFATKATGEYGRLEEECADVRAIFENLTEHSMVLMDEAFSSTSSFEGAHIALDVLRALSAYACRAIFSTHMHELISMYGEINEQSFSRSRIDTITAELAHGEKRTYRIKRAVPDGKSYAKSISDRYGLDFETLYKQRGITT